MPRPKSIQEEARLRREATGGGVIHDQQARHADPLKREQQKEGPRGRQPASAVYVEPPFWQDVPLDGRRLTFPPPPFTAALVAAPGPGNVANIIDFVVPAGYGYIIEIIELEVVEPLGRPLVTWNVLKDEAPIQGVGQNFTIDQPLSLDIAQDHRLNPNQRIRVEATNTSLALGFTAVARMKGWIYNMETYRQNMPSFNS
jgi:hypothetical protein